ncbi:MAG: hypothetical protein FWG96_00540 [Methanomassiliicoccaceae archaeon]|nr:hypothetical protein [Methanomassiliicoccaceae archaeon]
MTLSTSKSIEIVTGKTLKLKNVLSRYVISQDGTEMQKVMHMFNSYMKANRLTPYGPTTINTKSVFENGSLVQRSRMMVQVRETPAKVEPPYSFSELIRVENCVMARYHGNAASVQMAHGKIQVYAFENNIKLKGETYTVLIEQDGNDIMADVFMEAET